MAPVAANAFHIGCVPITDALRCLKDSSYNLFIQEQFSLLDRKHDVVVDLPGAVIPFSGLLASNEGSVQNVPVASCGELQVKMELPFHFWRKRQFLVTMAGRQPGSHIGLMISFLIRTWHKFRSGWFRRLGRSQAQ